MTRDIEDRCRTEVIELHRFFVEWFKGELSGDEAFERFSRVMADGFEIIPPDGRKMNRDEILSAVRSAHGLEAGGSFEIRIEKFESRLVGDGFLLATYQEWQRSGSGERARLSTAVFRARENTPNGVEWLHVHETWLSENS